MSGAISNYVSAVLIGTPRSLGGLIPDCAIEERSADRAMLPEHPVENIAVISDHIIIQPREITLRWSWSNASPANALGENAGTTLTAVLGFGFGNEQYSSQMYQTLLGYQKSGQLFSITTSKDQWLNMAILEIGVVTNSDSEFTCDAEISCREVILAQAYSTTVAPSANQANPQQTSPTQNQGTQQAQQTGIPTNQSLLSAGVNYIKGIL